MQKAQHRHHASGSVEGTTLPRSPPLQRHAPGCSDEDKLLLQVDGPSRLLCLFLLLPPHVRTQSRRCIEGSMSSPPAERQAGVGPAHRLSAPSRVSIHGSAGQPLFSSYPRIFFSRARCMVAWQFVFWGSPCSSCPGWPMRLSFSGKGQMYYSLCFIFL
ncbi:hypothetical protein ACQJBY_061423 [Aegilops geniculata]